MQILHIAEGQTPVPLHDLARRPQGGLLWIDFLRVESAHWATVIEPLLQVEIDAEHVADSLNATHPAFFDGTADYDMLIFEGLGPQDQSQNQPFPLQTRVGALFLFDGTLVTVRESDAESYDIIQQRLLGGRQRCPPSPVWLTTLLLDSMVDRYLRVREPLDQHLTQLQDELLDPENGRGDWRALLDGRRQVRRLEAVSEAQVESLDAWRRGSRFSWTQAEEVRLRDITEHVTRVMHHAGNMERDVEAAVQLHFAAVGYRTNRVMRTLTVISAVFFPLNLITGIYGMNFDNMPELHTRYGYFVALGAIFGVAVALLLLFRRRGYF